MKQIRQFNWRQHWKKKVEPHLARTAVQCSLDMGMQLLDPNWKRGNAPYRLGREPCRRVVEGKLSWYRPLGCCHWISFFAMAIGVINYPKLTWRMVSGDLHTVPVGFGADGKPCVVMDILFFDEHTAEWSIARSQIRSDTENNRNWDIAFRIFEERFVPTILATCLEQKSFSSTEEK